MRTLCAWPVPLPTRRWSRPRGPDVIPIGAAFWQPSATQAPQSILRRSTFLSVSSGCQEGCISPRFDQTTQAHDYLSNAV